MGAAPPWGQSLLRSYLTARSFPPPPSLDGASPTSHFPASDTVPSETNRPIRHLSLRHAASKADRIGLPVSASRHSRRRIARRGGVGAGRSAKRGTSAATTGPRGAAP